ncbi:MAG: SDR family oxidoreductase [Sphingobium sp.]
MTMRLSGKTAIVTGAAQGLGAAIAQSMAQEGAKVLLTDRNEAGAYDIAASINEALGANAALAAQHDVTNENDWARIIEIAKSQFGGLSVLVNNAGILVMGSVEDLSLDEWHRSMSVNCDSIFIGVKNALPVMKAHQPGSIVNVSSISGLIAGYNLAAYNASKAAGWLLTKSIALHCARAGWDIRCNSVHPSFIRTPILDDIVQERDEAIILGKLTKQVPLGRLGEPDDVASAVVYLASDESRFMTGAELKLDGGISAM